LDIPVLDTASNPVGSQSGTDYVIANNATYINSVQVTDQAAEQDAFIAVELDGNPSGTWNAGLQVWEVTSDPCLDAILERNATQIKTIASGATFNLITKLDGAANNGTWDGVDTLDFTSAACSPVTFQINAVNKESLSSGTTFNLITKLDGSVNSGSYDAPTDTLSFTSAACSPAALQINGTPQESIAAGATFNLIATLDGVAGGTYTPATDTLAFTSTGGWVRPSFWPTLPTLTAASEAGYILVLVYENRSNFFGLTINNSTIDWGDGTTSAPSGAQRSKNYNYATLSGTVYVDAITGENYKFATISITRTGAAITSVTFQSTSRKTTQAVDWNLSFPSATTFNIGGNVTTEHSYTQQIRVWASGTLPSLRNIRNLKALQLPVTRAWSTYGNCIGIGALDLGDQNFQASTGSISYVFGIGAIKSHGDLTANSVSDASYYISDNIYLTTFGDVNLAAATAINHFASGCNNLTSIGLITAPNATSYQNLFNFNYSLIAARFSNSAACTNTTNLINQCYSLELLHCPNLTRGVNFVNTQIGNYGMNIFASGDGILNGVGTASGAQTITITGTPFGALVTAADATALAIRLVLTTKGYTIAN
jgi:hypothetical protein